MIIFRPENPGTTRPQATHAVPRKRHVRELYNPDQMVAVLRRERARSDRQHCPFSIVLFRLDELPFRERTLLRLATILLRCIRETDDLGCYDRQTLCAVLPDTGPAGASMLVARVRKETAPKSYHPICTIYTYPDPPAPSDAPPPPRSNDRGRGDGDGSLGLDIRNVPPRAEHALRDTLGAMARAEIVPEPLTEHADAASRASDNLSGEPPCSEPTASELDAEKDVNAPIHAMSELFAEPLPWWKRLLDISVASTAIMVSSPLMIAAAMAIRISSPGPIIFAQRRTGLGGGPFTIYKFRTMCVDAERKQKQLKASSEQDGPAFKLKNDPRVFAVGRLLRKSSVDELPQLFNVLLGDMTLVGPRPLPVHEADAVAQWQQRRHDVTPGLTCIWQVEGRSRVKFDEWMRMDMRYARRRSLIKDLALVLKTIPAVLLRRGAN